MLSSLSIADRQAEGVTGMDAIAVGLGSSAGPGVSVPEVPERGTDSRSVGAFSVWLQSMLLSQGARPCRIRCAGMACSSVTQTLRGPNCISA